MKTSNVLESLLGLAEASTAETDRWTNGDQKEGTAAGDGGS